MRRSDQIGPRSSYAGSGPWPALAVLLVLSLSDPRTRSPPRPRNEKSLLECIESSCLPMNSLHKSLQSSISLPENGLSGFSADLGQQLVFGPGSLSTIGPSAREMGAGRVLLVTDPSIREAGHLEHALASLGEAKTESLIFDQVQENPTTGSVEEAASRLEEEKFDLIVAVGGGSVMDTAKAVNFLLSNGGRMEDYRGYGRAGKNMYPSIGVPTTAGTGSEAQSYALIASSQDHLKMACGDPGVRFRRVILDPDLLETAPRQVLAAAAVDALSHAVESLVSATSNPISRMFSCWSWRLLEPSCENAVNEGNREALGQMLIGAYLAGMAVELSMLGAAHACANPLTARFGVRHGAAVALLLPGVVRLNGLAVNADYGQLEGIDPVQAAESLAVRLAALRIRFDLPTSLVELGVDESSIEQLATEAAQQWTGQFNPVPLTTETATRIYESLF